MPNPHKSYFLLALILSAVLGAALWFFTPMHPLWIYLTTITLLTFAFYGLDKHRAIRQKSRIPEVVLHLLALAGGTVGAFAGQIVFHHKTKKLKFQMIFYAIVVVQTGFVLWSVWRHVR
jgi:uncharacterized membrane protein YsdA (DUF1294 family)